MKAVTIREHGELECVRVEEIAEPRPTEGEVILEVRAAALNHLDIWVRKGRPGVVLKGPHVLGSDASGVIAEIGPGVHGVKVGDEVILNPGLSCGGCEFCLRGERTARRFLTAMWVWITVVSAFLWTRRSCTMRLPVRRIRQLADADTDVVTVLQSAAADVAKLCRRQWIEAGLAIPALRAARG